MAWPQKWDGKNTASLIHTFGHLEFNESIEGCAKREVFEETGLDIKGLRYTAFTNDIFKEEKKHYVTLFIIAKYDYGTLQLKEPDKCEKWDWFN